ncbi:hypothetical protein FD09_GL002588 [Schleiferilactobacillus perolens DSM 12744]|uniref:VRR-NUC domain-containing protein n=1 Tax=Schleiferilactobacillus perolens DSM 12744 TaxID=1423792 RepID=A0A0R1N9J3_9LACO|nr:hypothetical protein FD09_GL002588 [Schleiferilactobacillus perolens DSM 12744]
MIYAGRIWFVELQQPGKKPRMNQVMMHKRLARQGFKVNIVDSKIAASEFVEEVKSWKQNSEGTSNTP